MIPSLSRTAHAASWQADRSAASYRVWSSGAMPGEPWTVTEEVDGQVSGWPEPMISTADGTTVKIVRRVGRIARSNRHASAGERRRSPSSTSRRRANGTDVCGS